MLDDLEELGDPACARCLVTLQVVGTVERPFWRCPECGLAVTG
jgi:tRNA(Ile2) C34 agmatinyltransferase TiaS